MDSSNVYYHYLKILLIVLLVLTFGLILFTFCVFLNAVPSIPSPLLNDIVIKKTILPTIYERYCNVLGGPCDSLPPIGFVVPPYFGRSIDYALSNKNNYILSFIGTDNEVGYSTTNPNTRSFVSLIKTALQNEYGMGGDGVVYVLKQDLTFTLYDIGVSVESNYKDWNIFYGGGPGSGFLSVNNTNIAKALFYGRGSKVDILLGKDCYNDAKRTFTAQIDNSSELFLIGAQNNVGCNDNTNTNKGYWSIQSVLTTTDDYHTILITSTGSQNGQLAGIRFTNPTGVIVDNYSRKGLDHPIYDWEAGAYYWGSHSTPIYQDSNTAIRWSSIDADIVFYFIDVKDVVLANLLFDKITANVVLPLRYVKEDIDIVIVFPVLDINDVITIETIQEWNDFVVRMSDWCYQYNVATVDLGLYFRNYTTSTFESTNNAIENLNKLGVYENNIEWPNYSEKIHSLIAQVLYPLTKNQYH